MYHIPNLYPAVLYMACRIELIGWKIDTTKIALLKLDQICTDGTCVPERKQKTPLLVFFYLYFFHIGKHRAVKKRSVVVAASKALFFWSNSTPPHVLYTVAHAWTMHVTRLSL